MYRSLTLSPVPPSWTALSDPLPSRLVNVRVEPDDGATSTLMGWSPSSIRRRPFVYDSRHRRERIGNCEKLAAALGTLDADVLLTTGSRNDPVDVDAPPNVQIERYVPQSLVVPHADVVIAHGGLGTITGTLIHGVPMVLFDIAVDHRVNIDRCVRLGIAEGLPGRGWTAEDLKLAVERTFASDKRAANARLGHRRRDRRPANTPRPCPSARGRGRATPVNVTEARELAEESGASFRREPDARNLRIAPTYRWSGASPTSVTTDRRRLPGLDNGSHEPG